MEDNFLTLDGFYIDSLAKFVASLRSASALNDVVIILPNHISIDLLKKTLVSHIGNTEAIIIPKIITFDDYLSIAKPKLIDNRSKYYEQVLIVTSIIKSYEKSNYNSRDSIKIAKQLIKIYWKIKKSSISFDKIESWVEEEVAEHWWITAEFLKFTFSRFENILSIRSNIHMSQTFKSRDMKFVFVGILDNLIQDCSIFDSIKEFEKRIILPPIPSVNNSLSGNLINNRYLHKKYTKFFAESGENINANLTKKFENKFFEFEDAFGEIDFLIHKILMRKSSITIITNDNFFNYLLVNRLICDQVEFNSSFGSKYTEFAEVEFLVNIARIKSEDGSIASLVALLKSRILSSNYIMETLLNFLNSSEKFHENILSVCKNEILDENVKTLLSVLLAWIDFPCSSFGELLSENLEVFVKILKFCKLSIISENINKFNEFIIDIKSLKDAEFTVAPCEYCDLLNEIFSLKYSRPFNRNANVFILTPDDALLVDSDEIYFADFNQESYIKSEDNIWLTSKILRKLNLFAEEEEFEKLLYIVSTKISRQGIFFTRSKYKDGSLQEKCAILNFIDNVESVIPEKIIRKNVKKIGREEIRLNQEDFPKILYATNIELLMRDPYGFFAKKILGVKKQKNALSTPQNSDFGIIIHDLIELKSSNSGLQNDEIIDQLFELKAIPKSIRILWKNPVISILQKIDELNANASLGNIVVYSEVTGSCDIFLGEKSVELRAIADRIELSNTKIRIVDFKTGYVPSKKDLFSGKSPQLIIEAIILLEHGFKISINNREIELVYIKINTKSPFVEEIVIPMTLEEILEHKVAMIEFLKYYYCDKTLISPKPLPDFWRPTYSDYDHLRRL